ncbi:MAG: AmmeMemoRadiSam system protein B, partial [Victivallales bacterium]|nr:AmmeMemoRadiSam system protein B [Victivallales bacterium]
MKRLWLGVLLSGWVALGAAETGKVMHSPLAEEGWYTGNPRLLRAQIEDAMESSGEKKYGRIIALVLPHAGYAYSGPTAAAGMVQIQGSKYRRVIVIGPSHHADLANRIAIPKTAEAWQTPLGVTPLDTAALQELRQYDFTLSSDAVEKKEHSVQIELPLLQCALSDFKLVPIVVGQLDPKAIDKVAAALRRITDTATLVVASSDFTHYGEKFNYTPFGSGSAVPQKIQQLDHDAIRLLTGRDRAGFAALLQQTGATICGRDVLQVLLTMLPRGAVVRELHYDTSGNQTGDYSNSVSYVALAVSGAWNQNTPASAPVAKATAAPVKAAMPAAAATPEKQVKKAIVLSPADRQTLLTMARKSIEIYMQSRRAPSPARLKITVPPALEQDCGAFVTL